MAERRTRSGEARGEGTDVSFDTGEPMGKADRRRGPRFNYRSCLMSDSILQPSNGNTSKPCQPLPSRTRKFFLLTAHIFRQSAELCIFFSAVNYAKTHSGVLTSENTTRGAFNDAFEARRSMRRSDKGSKKSATFLRCLVTPGRSAHICSILCPRLTRVKTEINSKGGVAALVCFPDERCHSEQTRNVEAVGCPTGGKTLWILVTLILHDLCNNHEFNVVKTL